MLYSLIIATLFFSIGSCYCQNLCIDHGCSSFDRSISYPSLYNEYCYCYNCHYGTPTRLIKQPYYMGPSIVQWLPPI